MSNDSEHIQIFVTSSNHIFTINNNPKSLRLFAGLLAIAQDSRYKVKSGDRIKINTYDLHWEMDLFCSEYKINPRLLPTPEYIKKYIERLPSEVQTLDYDDGELNTFIIFSEKDFINILDRLIPWKDKNLLCDIDYRMYPYYEDQ